MMMKPLPKAAQSWRELFADPKQAAALSQSTWQRWQNYQALSENLLIRQARLARDMWACACRPGFDLTLWEQQSQLQKAVLDRVAAQQAEGARELLTILLGAGRTRQANTVSKLMEGEREKLLHLDDTLHERVIGQDEAVEKVCEALVGMVVFF